MEARKNSEYDLADFQTRLSFLHINIEKVVGELEKERQDILEKLETSYKCHMRSELKRLQSFISYESLSSWCPKKMAAAGFYYTGLKRSVQCFCCGLVFCSTSLRTPPYEDHQKFQPDCEFIQGKDVGNIPKYDVRVQNPEENLAERSEKYKAEEARLESYDNWPFYTKTQPALLATAGFFFTGNKDIVRCFSCRGCLGNWEEDDDPWKEHAKWFPECEFLKSKKSEEEIKQFIQNYHGFIGVMGKHFTTTWQRKMCPLDAGNPVTNIFEDEEVRQDSFKTWPKDAHADPTALAKAGFFYIGTSDNVQCFSCGLRIHSFEPGDDVWAEHMKFKSKCKYLSNSMSVEGKQALCDRRDALPAQEVPVYCAAESESKCSIRSVCGGVSLGKQWLGEAKHLHDHLIRIYKDNKFRKLGSFGESSHVAIDLKTLYADISIVSKDTRNQPVQQLTLPEVLANLSFITMLEGEAGCGKTALLRKIAILWASGCPILSRFSLVFYLSLKSTDREQSLAEIICKQLAEPSLPLTDLTLKDIIHQLKNQVLFLLDDFSEVGSVPSAIEELMRKNHLNRLCLVVAVRTDRSGQVRQYAKTVLGIREFPLYSSVYMYQNLFSHNISVVEKLFVELAKSKTFQASLKTPLFAIALCTFWIQYPSADLFSETALFKAYLLYNTLRFPEEGQKLKALLSSCAELALRGLFGSCFDFTEEHLIDATVNEADALRLGLLSKFTTQRLHPVYSFFHPSFQEFLAGKRLGELLESDVQEERGQGFHYLQQVDTFLKAACHFHYFLNYTCQTSSKAVPIIINHLFSLIKSKRSFECHSENNAYLQQHPELAVIEQQLLVLIKINQEEFLSFVIHLLLNFAINSAYTSQTVNVCTPIILQFLMGKALTFDLSSLQNDTILRFLIEHPESFPLLDRLTLIIKGNRERAKINHSMVLDCYDRLGVPAVDQDYSSAFQLFQDDIEKVEYEAYLPVHTFPEISPFESAQLSDRTALLIIEAVNIDTANQNVLINLAAVLSVSDRIALCLNNSSGFVESIRLVIEQHSTSFTKCSLCNTELSTMEQELLLAMSSLESLAFMSLKSEQLPVHLFSNLDKYSHLKELSFSMSGEQRVFDKIPNNLKNLQKMERLIIDNANLVYDSSKLVEFIQNFPNLTVLHLNCNSFPDFEALVTVISFYEKLEAIHLKGSFLTDHQQALFVSVLPKFKALKILELKQCFTDKKTSELFACSLASLVHLEKLSLPEGPGVVQASTSIVHQFQHLHSIQMLSFGNNSLDDNSLLELAIAAKDGQLQTLQKLEIIAHHDITESGWRNFFRMLDNLPNLSTLNIMRLYTQQIKCHATTVMSFVQCVSRLPSLMTVFMQGWLLDEEDLKMFNAMKEKHPQSKSLHLHWQWLLPFSPTILN
nr:baculoviral IAP repeat-containing protein 1 isoform X2 [Geotrypetes seraphini]